LKLSQMLCLRIFSAAQFFGEYRSFGPILFAITVSPIPRGSEQENVIPANVE
jgi:hypothetical protein